MRTAKEILDHVMKDVLYTPPEMAVEKMQMKWFPQLKEAAALCAVKRDLSDEFLHAMRDKMEHGRNQGREGWDSHWKNTDDKPIQLLARLKEETEELVVAMEKGDLNLILHEAADVANFAMIRLPYLSLHLLEF